MVSATRSGCLRREYFGQDEARTRQHLTRGFGIEEKHKMVFDFFRRASAEVPEQKVSATGPVVAYQSSGRVAWSPRDTA